jgi:hypothetical protein
MAPSDWDYKDDHFIAGSEHDQIFESADYQELGAKLTKALTHANKFMDRLCAEKKVMHDLMRRLSACLSELARSPNRLSEEADVFQQMAEMLVRTVRKS